MTEILVLGFRTLVEDVSGLISKVNSLQGEGKVVQLLNADGVAGQEHIIHATNQALESFKRNDNIANDLGLEICVRASAQRQISKALELLGLNMGVNKICAVLINFNDKTVKELELLLERDDSVLEPDELILKDLYQISDVEIESCRGIIRVMIERTSVLVLET
jgi:KEOPS complex subunit Cgi121